jgi:hypothetical protein
MSGSCGQCYDAGQIKLHEMELHKTPGSTADIPFKAAKERREIEFFALRPREELGHVSLDALPTYGTNALAHAGFPSLFRERWLRPPRLGERTVQER